MNEDLATICQAIDDLADRHGCAVVVYRTGDELRIDLQRDGATVATLEAAVDGEDGLWTQVTTEDPALAEMLESALDEALGAADYVLPGSEEVN